MPPAPALEIGCFRPSHLPRVLAIESVAFGADAYTRATFLGFHTRCSEYFLIAKRARRIVGYIVAGTEGRRAEIISVAVDPDHRRQGIAAALLKSVLDRLRDGGARSAALMVRTDNIPAIRFYRRFGFRRIGQVPAYYGHGRPGVRMHRLL